MGQKLPIPIKMENFSLRHACGPIFGCDLGNSTARQHKGSNPRGTYVIIKKNNSCGPYKELESQQTDGHRVYNVNFQYV